MVPLHPLEDPSSQLHCSFLPNLSHSHQQNLSKKDSQGKLLRARPTPIKYSTRCVPGITNLGPNSKCVIFRTDTERQNILNIRFDLNNYNWFMEALMAKHKTCKMEIFTRRTIQRCPDCRAIILNFEQIPIIMLVITVLGLISSQVSICQDEGSALI